MNRRILIPAARLLVGLWCLMLVGSCSDEKDYRSHFHNYIQLSVKGNPSLNEDEKRPVTVTLLLANTLEEDAVITLELADNKEEVLRLEQPEITLKAGEKTAEIAVCSNGKGILQQPHTVTLRVRSFTDARMQPWNELPIIVKPGKEIPELSEAQLKLIAGYKEKWGLDLFRFMGRLSCRTTVTFNSGDLGVLYDNEDTRTYEGTSVITLSEHATADLPVLKMVSNPLGMTDFLWEMMRRCTVDNATWKDEVNNPEPAAILKAIGYDEKKETFEAVLDEIRLLPQKQQVTFLKPVMTSPGNEEHEIEPTWTTVVPFQYHFSAWDRFLQEAEKQATYTFREGEVTVEKPLKEAPEAYQLNPVFHLTYSNLDSDGWEEGNFVTPTASYNLEKGTLSFIFPWDCQISSGGYTQIRTVYTLQQPEKSGE